MPVDWNNLFLKNLAFQLTTTVCKGRMLLIVNKGHNHRNRINTGSSFSHSLYSEEIWVHILEYKINMRCCLSCEGHMQILLMACACRIHKPSCQERLNNTSTAPFNIEEGMHGFCIQQRTALL